VAAASRVKAQAGWQFDFYWKLLGEQKGNAVSIGNLRRTGRNGTHGNVLALSPWGKPSSALLTGEIAGLPIIFLSRHDKSHRL
jgi:hypothetical protein